VAQLRCGFTTWFFGCRTLCVIRKGCVFSCAPTRYNGISADAPRVGPTEKESHAGLLFSGPNGTDATITGGSFEIQVGVCVAICISVGIGVQ